ncbi:SEC14-like protein 2 isoform X1 [Folsomia candida]|uniref:SEC14-like protein 2 isoform X1 n=1 Tax=Folsomia candida TaxID=158441 RepID=UPI000B8FFDFD|nr:SEC14-like protein 2 isoform X1 [Folsomia candida]
MEAVSEHETRLVQELRKRTSDLNLAQEYVKDKNLVRFLRARRQSITPAEQMLRKNHVWLKENDVDAIVSKPDPPGWGVNGLFPWHICGFDKNDNPVIVLKFGAWDVKSVVSNQREDFMSYAIKTMELCARSCAHSTREKSWMGQLVGIYDFKDLSFSQMRCFEVIQITMQASQLFDSNYPELLGRGFVVNAPMTFQILWKLICPVMDDKTARKITVLGSDTDIMRNEIGKYVPFAEFPKMYGGDGDNDLKIIVAPDGSPIRLSKM